jgi:hypothetical protein
MAELHRKTIENNKEMGKTQDCEKTFFCSLKLDVNP